MTSLSNSPIAERLSRLNFSRLNLRQMGAVIFCCSWGIRAAAVVMFTVYRSGQTIDPETIHVAQSLASGQGFSNPYVCPTGPTAHTSPLYPFLVSLLFRVFPPGMSREIAVFLFSAALTSLALALLPWLAVRLRLDRRAGFLAGLAGAACPLFLWIERGKWESPLAAFLLVMGLGLFARFSDAPGIRRAIVPGSVWGLAFLAYPTLVVPFAANVLLWLWRGRDRLRILWKPFAALAATVAIVLLPWTIRNSLVFHRLMFVRSNLGMELRVAYNPLASPTFEGSVDNGVFRIHPYSNPAACLELAQRGEDATNQMFQQEALDWMRAHPAGTARLILEHVVVFWRMALPGANPLKTLASELLTLLGLLGLWQCFRKYRYAAQVLGVTLLAFSLVYSVFMFEVRYRYPMHPLILLLAAVFVTEVASKARRRPHVLSMKHDS